MLSRFHWVQCNTVRISAQECSEQPEKPLTLAGVVVYGGTTLGRTLCYFAPESSLQYVAIKMDKLELAKSLGQCPRLMLFEYSSVREELIDNTDPNLRFHANCSNYEKLRQFTLQTSSPGLKLQMLYDPFNAPVSELYYEFTLTSFGESGFHSI
ncbi:unnamed protein product [Echinostoma caproni]|uniref:Protein kinase domain-containing protein n=1 Tax=Echinostoma caproni TaxID=27848 RepID=A0A183B1L4_9TREM|nr:unnamed protein product [Echinostoma caproni]